jgi:hypothetical protein
MPRVKQASKQKRTTKAAAVKALGAAGLSFSLVGSGASASTMPTASIPQSDNTSPNQRFVLDEEEMADVSLATFYVFDRENVGSGVQLARGCGGCGGCGHGGGGCGHGGGGCAGGHIGGGCVGGHIGGGCVGGRIGGGCVGLRGCGGAGFVGCRGCGGFRGCRGFRGCGCGGCGGCGVGIWFDDDIWFGGWGDGGCCASWGACRLC